MDPRRRNISTTIEERFTREGSAPIAVCRALFGASNLIGTDSAVVRALRVKRTFTHD